MSQLVASIIASLSTYWRIEVHVYYKAMDESVSCFYHCQPAVLTGVLKYMCIIRQGMSQYLMT